MNKEIFLNNPMENGSSSADMISCVSNIVNSGCRIVESVSVIVQSCNSRDVEMFRISQMAQIKHEQLVKEINEFNTVWNFKSTFMQNAFASERFSGEMLLEAYIRSLEK